MANMLDVAEQNIIVVQSQEYKFFEQLTQKYGIPWSLEEKKSSLLPLSKAYVGYINTPIRTITLKPKYVEIGFEHIVRMYLYVYGYRPTDSAAILDVSSADTSVDVASMFLSNLKRNIQEGIIRTYKREERKSKAIKGRVDYTQTYKNMLVRKRNPVATTVSTLSVKNDINDLIQTALHKLRHVEQFSSESASLSMYFEGAATNVQHGSDLLSSVHFNSNTLRYRRTLIYAAMIIDQLSYSDTGSTIGTDSFLVNFDRLFEDFVAKVLKEIPEKKEFSTWATKKKFARVVGNFAGDEDREYQPDILFRYTAEDEKYDYMPSAYAVLDVKNKAYGVFKNPDIYQMLTYTKLLHGQKSVLLYPSFHNRRPESLELNQEIFKPATISACFVNIAEETGEAFLRSIRMFADTVLKTILDIPLS